MPQLTNLPTVFNEHPMPFVREGVLVIRGHTQESAWGCQLPFLDWVQKELRQMRETHERIKHDLERIPYSFSIAAERVQKVSEILRSIPSQLQDNHRRLHENESLLAISITELGRLRDYVTYSTVIAPESLNALYDSIVTYQRSCRGYVKSCEQLRMYLETSAVDAELSALRSDFFNATTALSDEEKLFSKTVCEPLQVLLSSRRLYNFIGGTVRNAHYSLYVCTYLILFLGARVFGVWGLLFSVLLMGVSFQRRYHLRN